MSDIRDELPPGAPDPHLQSWKNVRNVIAVKIGNVQNEIQELREKMIGKQAELAGLREGERAVERFQPMSCNPKEG